MAILTGSSTEAWTQIASRAGMTMGGVRDCLPYADELLRSRVLTAEGLDYVVTTSGDVRAGQGYLTGAYPVSRGYLVMMRQPLCEFHHDDAESARERHRQLANVLAQAGVQVVRGRASVAARKRAETSVAKVVRTSRIWAEDSLDIILGSVSDADLAAIRN